MKTFKQLREESTALQPVKMMVVFSDGERKSYAVPKDTSFKDYVEKKIVPVEQGRDVVHYGVEDKPNTTKTTITSVKESLDESFRYNVDHMPGATRRDLSNVKSNEKDNVHSVWGTLEKAQTVADKHGFKVKKNSYVDPYDKKTKFEYHVIKESDEAYAAAEKAKEEKRKMDNITPSDKKTLGKIADLLNKEKKQVKEDVLVEYKATNYEYKNKAGKTANLASITWGDGDVEHITTTMGGRPTRHSTKDKAHASLRVRGFEPTGEVTNESVELDEGMNDITPQDASDIIHIHGGKKDFKSLRPKAQTDLDNLAHDYGVKSKTADKSHGHHFWDKLHIKASRLSEAVEKDPIAIAKSASDKAGKSGSRQNHNLAAQAHMNAVKYCEQNKDDEAAEFHRQRADFHTKNSLG